MCSGTCLATMSMPIFARNRFVPTPAVAQMPVLSYTAFIIMDAISMPSFP